MKLLTMPLSKVWRSSASSQQAYWKILCLSSPFHANYDKSSRDYQDKCRQHTPVEFPYAAKNIFGEYRLLYTSYVRCIAYLDNIQTERKAGRKELSVLAATTGQTLSQAGMNKSLNEFLARRQRTAVSSRAVSAPVAPVRLNNIQYNIRDDGGEARKVCHSLLQVLLISRYGGSDAHIVLSSYAETGSSQRPLYFHCTNPTSDQETPIW